MQNELVIVYKDPTTLKPRPDNPRTHPNRQLRKLRASLRNNGFIRPVLVDDADTIIAGHGITEAAKREGLKRIPTVCVGGMPPAQIRAYVIADNRIAEEAGWDREILLLVLDELDSAGFDVNQTGFDPPEIDLLQLEGHRRNGDEDVIPSVVRQPLSRRGDLWTFGKHRLLCGDALCAADYRRLLAGKKAQMVFADVPYNVKIDGNVSGLGQHRHREFSFASGEMSEEEFTQFQEDAFTNMARFTVPGSIHFICMDWRHMPEITTAGRNAYSSLLNVCVWVKNNGGMGSLYRSRHELVFVFKNGAAKHINNVELGRYGRNRTNVWEYDGANTFGSERDATLAMHPTVKPVKMVADAILDCSRRDGLILDPFGGVGTTVLAAESVGRQARLMEIDPIYVDAAVLRCERAFKCEAVLEGDGRTFRELQRERQKEPAEITDVPQSVPEES